MSAVRGDEVRLEISKVVHGGYGLGRHDGKVFFVPGTAPDDVVTVIVREAKKTHCFADVIAVHTPGPDRRDHIWPEAEWSRPPGLRPGGADLGHVDLAAQRRIKTEVLQESMIRHGGVDASWMAAVAVEAVAGRGDGRAWRTRETLHVKNGVVGPLAMRSHDVVPVTSLPLVVEEISQSGILDTRWSDTTSIRAVWSPVTGLSITSSTDNPTPVTQRVHDVDFALDSASFWQVHHDAAEVLWDAVVAAVDTEAFDPHAPNLDLYGGVGLFAVALTRLGGEETRVVSVESVATASAFAKHNLAAMPHAKTVLSGAEEFLAAEVASLDDTRRAAYRRATVVVDPPRQGVGNSGVDALVGLAPKQIVYVACDPVALARDTKSLHHAGYHLRTLQGFDLFPHTHHMEAVAGFIRD